MRGCLLNRELKGCGTKWSWPNFSFRACNWWYREKATGLQHVTSCTWSSSVRRSATLPLTTQPVRHSVTHNSQLFRHSATHNSQPVRHSATHNSQPVSHSCSHSASIRNEPSHHFAARICTLDASLRHLENRGVQNTATTIRNSHYTIALHRDADAGGCAV